MESSSARSVPRHSNICSPETGCDKHKAKNPRVVLILTKDSLINILKKSDVSDRKYLAILKDIQDETGAILMEGNLKKEIQDSMKSFEEPPIKTQTLYAQIQLE